jgi:hypothetical protein
MFRDSDLIDFGAEQEYLDRQEYEELMANAPEDFFPNDEDYPVDEPDSDVGDWGYLDDESYPYYDEDEGRFDDDPNPYEGTFSDDYDYGGEG